MVEKKGGDGQEWVICFGGALTNPLNYLIFPKSPEKGFFFQGEAVRRFGGFFHVYTCTYTYTVCMYVCNVCWKKKKKKKKKKKRVGEHFLDFWGAYIFFDDPLG